MMPGGMPYLFVDTSKNFLEKPKTIKSILEEKNENH